VLLADHLSNVRDCAAALVQAFDACLEEWEREALLAAALWHDVGKAHPVFQEALLKPLPEHDRAARWGHLWAKSAWKGRLEYARRYFRHELASALALLGSPFEASGLKGRAQDLAAYLVAAHHGKVRLVIRALRNEEGPPEPDRRFARGVWDGDSLGPVGVDGITVPRLELDLSVMEVGRGPDGRPSWVERALRLRDTLGPFRLAFLEALLRVADWRASAAEGGPGGA
jgi:CRISPR-associated endonuclease/helicase Cas3